MFPSCNAAADSAAANGGAWQRRVLVVDDSAINRQVAIAMLEAVGCRVIPAVNGREAVKIFERGEQLDIVFMDCQMPEMDGFAATKEIRRIEKQNGVPARGPLPVVALTANALTGDRDRCLAAGMTDFLSKPFKRVDLEDTLVRWTATSRTPPAATTTTSTQEASPVATPQPIPQPQASFVDRDVIDSLKKLTVSGRPDLLSRVARHFLTALPEQVARLRKSLDQDDVPDVAFVAHAIKGASATIGAHELSRRAAALEENARNRRGDLKSLFARLSDIQVQTMDAVQAHLQSHLAQDHQIKC